jgi:hypothetical protein
MDTAASLGEGFAGIDLEGEGVVVDGLFEILGAFAANAVRVGGRQVVLGGGPLFGEGFAGPNLEGEGVVVDGLFESNRSGGRYFR